MLVDVVVDTCVLMHADNPEYAKRSAAQKFLKTLRAASTELRIDEGYSSVESQNTSAIATEYLENLVPGSMGLDLIEHCAQSGRLITTSTKVRTEVNKAIRQLIPDKTDHKFVKVAVNSHEHVLTTHDEHDIGRARRELERLSVKVRDAEGCCRLL